MRGIDKENRMRVQSQSIEAGLVILPREANGLEEALAEIRRFPGGVHDDQIAAISQFLTQVTESALVI